MTNTNRPTSATARQARELIDGQLTESAEEREERLDEELATARRIARGGRRGEHDSRTDSADVIQAAQLARGYGGA
ncbi:hypothetical protein [Clavibacter zhangzhiyongii]|uniref:hypothetical protein n=1 Tax=Clavibacter zhangzhiyongii TaxID=2768071 RepID=UPI0039DFD748